MLLELFDKYGCDKGTEKHRYDRCYEPEFQGIRESSLNILEVGTFKGNSIESWVEYFPNANIYTIDIFDRVKPEDINILNHERVSWIKQDSTSEDCASNIRKNFGKDIKFDIIIDDGAHWYYTIRDTFNNLFPLLNENGSYYIEDVYNMSIDAVQDMMSEHPWMLENTHRYNIDDWNKLLYTINKYNVKHFNYIEASTGILDSYILKITQ